jgi:TonB family protein
VAYAANTPVKTAGPNTVGMIGPERQKQIERQPVTSAFVQTEDLKKTAAVPAGVQKAITTVIADTTRAADNQAPAAKVAAVSARVATVLPAVSVPVGGWASLDSYLTDNNKLSKDKSGKFVELSFLIDKDGTPSDIKVIKGAAPEFDAEAIRLIKEGPKWEQPKSADSRVSYTIAF